LWAELDRNVLQRTFEHPSGQRLRVAAVAIDSGYETQRVYRFVKDRQYQRVWAIKGIDGAGRPIMGRPTNRNRLKVPMYPVGVDDAKSLWYGRLNIERDGEGSTPGYVHFPDRFPYDEEYFRQLTAEKLVLKQSPNGHHKRVWIRRHGRRAEVLDVRVYALAALEGLIATGVRLEVEAQALRPPEKDPESPPPESDEDDWASGGKWGRSW
jgi:phage terminase large subunit GpA-like protein